MDDLFKIIREMQGKKSAGHLMEVENHIKQYTCDSKKEAAAA